ncbi:MAG: helix-hairpin-helix domain-containing protein [Oscillospiraceae bacterium]|nr:helix-hairpin-helix domain-containing protein [Oscillospiraceae bacterium]
MNSPRKRTELLLAAAALLIAAGVLFAAGARSAMSSPEPTQPQAGTAQANPFETAQPGTDAAEINESQVNGSYAVGYTGIVVYPPGEEAPLQPRDGETAPPPQATQPLPEQTLPPQAPAQPPAQPAYPVNLNTATQAQLETLPGIGPVKAQAILAWRAANGGFANANQLLQVKGIGQKTLEGLLPYITW